MQCNQWLIWTRDKTSANRRNSCIGARHAPYLCWM